MNDKASRKLRSNKGKRRSSESDHDEGRKKAKNDSKEPESESPFASDADDFGEESVEENRHKSTQTDPSEWMGLAHIEAIDLTEESQMKENVAKLLDSHRRLKQVI